MDKLYIQRPETGAVLILNQVRNKVCCLCIYGYREDIRTRTGFFSFLNFYLLMYLPFYRDLGSSISCTFDDSKYSFSESIK